MDSRAQENADQGAVAKGAVSVPQVDASKFVTVAADYATPSVTWEYHRVVYNFLDFANRWPDGMAAHFSWPWPGGWRVIGLWKSEAHHERYFADVAMEEISKAIGLLGAVSNRQGATDVEPERSRVANIIIGPLARSFVDIGPDTEGTAINALGTEPIAVEIEVNGMDASVYQELIKRLGYESAIPAELIAHCALETDDAITIFEIWSARGHALTTLGEAVLPAIELIAGRRKEDLTTDYETHELRRIIFSDELVSAFGF